MVTVNATVSYDNVLSVSWSQSPLIGGFDARTYDVIIYKDSDGTTPIHKEYDLTVTSYSYTLDGEGTYYVKVAAVNTRYYEWYSLSSAVKVETENYVPGDMDGDGSITVSDALAALRIAAKLVAETPEAIAIGDIDGDGKIAVNDALAILRVAAKLTDSL